MHALCRPSSEEGPSRWRMRALGNVQRGSCGLGCWRLRDDRVRASHKMTHSMAARAALTCALHVTELDRLAPGAPGGRRSLQRHVLQQQLRGLGNRLQAIAYVGRCSKSVPPRSVPPGGA